MESLCRIGDRVVCVKGTFFKGVKKGSIYTIRRVARNQYGEFAYEFEEIDTPFGFIGFKTIRFRPLQDNEKISETRKSSLSNKISIKKKDRLVHLN